MNLDTKIQALQDELELIHGERLHGRLPEIDWTARKQVWRAKLKRLIWEERRKHGTR